MLVVKELVRSIAYYKFALISRTESFILKLELCEFFAGGFNREYVVKFAIDNNDGPWGYKRQDIRALAKGVEIWDVVA